jgi:hypothetical protein
MTEGQTGSEIFSGGRLMSDGYYKPDFFAIYTVIILFRWLRCCYWQLMYKDELYALLPFRPSIFVQRSLSYIFSSTHETILFSCCIASLLLPSHLSMESLP